MGGKRILCVTPTRGSAKPGCLKKQEGAAGREHGDMRRLLRADNQERLSKHRVAGKGETLMKATRRRPNLRGSLKGEKRGKKRS